MSNIFYGHAPLKSGLFLLNLDSSNTHIHNVETKRCRVDNDGATYLWHCRLGHIGVKHMKKLHTDGLLEPLDFESLGTSEPCLMGKMTKNTVLRYYGESNRFIGNNTYRCMRSNEC